MIPPYDTSDEYDFGFTGFDTHHDKPEERICPHPEGHLWQQQPYQLLSNPPQNVYYCVRDGCNAVRNVMQHRSPRPLIPDSKLPRR